MKKKKKEEKKKLSSPLKVSRIQLLVLGLFKGEWPRFLLHEIERVVARNSLDTDPYSSRIRVNLGVTCSQYETRRVRRVSWTVFFPFRIFSVARRIRSPDTSLKGGVSRPENCLIRPDLLPQASTTVQVKKFYSYLVFHSTTSIMGIPYPSLETAYCGL